MNTRIALILGFGLIAGCGGGASSGGPPAVPSGFLYAYGVGPPNSLPTAIFGFTAYSDGSLSPVPGTPPSAYPGGGGPVALTRDSELLYTTNIYEIDAFQVNADGSLSKAPSPSFDTGPYTAVVGLVAHPTADFLYASSDADVVSVFTIDPATGALNPTSSVSVPNVTGNGGIQIENSGVITPDGRYFYQNYVIGQFPQLVVQIAGFSIDSATGALSPVPGSPVSPPGIPSPVYATPSPMVIHSTGKFLYASYQIVVENVGADGGVAAFSIDPDSGALTAVPGSPFSVGVPNSVAIDASGRFLIVSTSPRLGEGPGNCLAVLSIDPGTGGLTAVPGSPFGPLQGCAGIAADPSQPFVYAGSINPNPAIVFGFSIDQTSGALAPISQTAVPGSELVGASVVALTH